MPKYTGEGYTIVTGTADDTHYWAHQRDVTWPNSVIAGHNIVIVFEPNGDLVDYSLTDERGQHVEIDIPANELTALAEWVLGPEHPAVKNR